MLNKRLIGFFCTIVGAVCSIILFLSLSSKIKTEHAIDKSSSIINRTMNVSLQQPDICTSLSNSLSLCGYSIMIQHNNSQHLCHEFANLAEVHEIFKLVTRCVLSVNQTENCPRKTKLSMLGNEDTIFVQSVTKPTPTEFYSYYKNANVDTVIIIFNQQCSLSLQEFIYVINLVKY